MQLATVLVAGSLSASLSAEDRPNVIVILADDLGYGDLSCYGHPKFRTPNLDRLASEGVRLTQFNSPAPFCAPTRAALLTGQYPLRCGLPSNPAPDASPLVDPLHLPTDAVLLPGLLKEYGYATCMVGKWHLGHKEKAWWPKSRGFDDYLGILYSNDMRPVQLIDGDEVAEYPLVQATLTQRYTDRAIDFIEQNKDQPFFLYLAHAMPHKPLACSEEFYQKSGAGQYGDVLMDLDASIGRLLERLDSLGLRETTLVLFTSDNGPWFGGSTGRLRGMKSTCWEGGYRVPCIVRWPGRVPAGKVSDELAITMDLFATVLSATGAQTPVDRKIDGIDLLPVLEGKASGVHDVIVGQNGAARLSTVRDARWKLHVLSQRPPAAPKSYAEVPDRRSPDGVTILAPHEQAPRTEYPGLRTGDETVAMSLFDLESDPGEQINVAAEHPEVVSELKAKFDAADRELRLPHQQ